MWYYGGRHWWVYIQGERVFIDPWRFSLDIDRYIFEGYRGMFW